MSFGRIALALTAAYSLTPPIVDAGLADGPRRSASSSAPAAIDPSGGFVTLVSGGSPMILIRRSSFTMGSSDEDAVRALAECQRLTPGHLCNPSEFSDELPMHRVTLSAYWLDRTEVTVAAYARCVAASRCKPLPLGDGARRFDRPEYPASLVTWDEARDYCAFRGARLPTEAEFERAARGVSGRTFPWGQIYNSHVANHGRYDWNSPMAAAGGDPTDGGDGFVELAPVASFPEGRTPDGILDLAGNVAEWVSDLYAAQYEPGAVEDPQGPDSARAAALSGKGSGGGARVLRGGSYETGPLALRGASRAVAPPSTRRPSIGFRCARSTSERN